MLADAVAGMFEDLDAFLAARPFNRLLLVHGYEVAGIDVESHRNPFAAALGAEYATVSIRLPIVWEVEPGRVPARASDTPTTEEPDRLRSMLESYVDTGGLARAGVVEFTAWRLERPVDAVPSRGTAQDAHWAVDAEFVAH
jgi:hypothetical protein